MKQSRLESFIESMLNVGSGMIIAFALTQFLLAPMLGFQINIQQNVVLTIILTMVSVMRGFLWRRFFANELHKVIAKYLPGKPRGLSSILDKHKDTVFSRHREIKQDLDLTPIHTTSSNKFSEYLVQQQKQMQEQLDKQAEEALATLLQDLTGEEVEDGVVITNIKSDKDIGVEWPEEFYDIAHVMKLGAKKYGKDSWLDEGNESMSDRNNFASMSRHAAESYVCPTIEDPESGLDPLLHLACRALMKYTRKQRGIDNPMLALDGDD